MCLSTWTNSNTPVHVLNFQMDMVVSKLQWSNGMVLLSDDKTKIYESINNASLNEIEDLKEKEVENSSSQGIQNCRITFV